MKVLYITNLPAPYRVDFFNILGKECELTVIYERYRAKDRDEKWKSNQTNNTYQEIYLNGISIGNEASLAPKIISYIKKYKGDIIILGGYSSPNAILAIAYMKTHGIKFGITYDGMLPNNEHKSIKAKFKARLMQAASFHLSPGTVTTDELKRYGVACNKIYEYPFSSVHRNQISNAKKKGDIVNIIYVGQMIYRKGVDLLIEAFKNIDCRNAELYLIGGNTEEYNEKDRIHYIPFKTQNELENYWSIADLFVLPTRYDVWGLVVNEALARGIPVITTDRCGAGLEQIQHGVNGYIIHANDAKAIQIAIEDFLKIEPHQMKEKALATAYKWTIEGMSERTVHILNELHNSNE